MTANGATTCDGTGLMARVGMRVREARQALSLSRRALSEASGVSQRYLALLEGGQGNISIALLEKVAAALGSSVETLVAVSAPPETGAEAADFAERFAAATPAQREAALAALDSDDGRAERICLIGLRGAGKSTLGRLIGEELGAPFVELGDEIQKLAGLPVAEVIALYGNEGYRELELRALRQAAAGDRLVLAVAGGIVDAPETYDYLLRRFHTVWLKAAPDEHMQRVRAQGDERPMAGHPRAMEELMAILDRRAARYARADLEIDTEGKSVEASKLEALAALQKLGVAAEA